MVPVSLFGTKSMPRPDGVKLSRSLRVLASAATAVAAIRGRPREPTFYGQPYGVSLASVAMGLLHGMGLSYGTALPLTLIVPAIAAWWVLAWGCMRWGWWLGALLATTTADGTVSTVAPGRSGSGCSKKRTERASPMLVGSVSVFRDGKHALRTAVTVPHRLDEAHS